MSDASAVESEAGSCVGGPEAVLHLCNGVDGTGDLTHWANVLDLASQVHADTNGWVYILTLQRVITWYREDGGTVSI